MDAPFQVGTVGGGHGNFTAVEVADETAAAVVADWGVGQDQSHPLPHPQPRCARHLQDALPRLRPWYAPRHIINLL